MHSPDTGKISHVRKHILGAARQLIENKGSSQYSLLELVAKAEVDIDTIRAEFATPAIVNQTMLAKG